MEPTSKKRDSLFNLWYVIVVVAYIVLGAFDDVRKYFIWLKPLPVLLLILQVHSFRNFDKVVKFIEFGLLFGMIGDIFLEITGSQHYFHIGVAAFFLGHICYIFAFLNSIKLLQTQTSTRSSVFFSVIYGLILAGAMMTNLHYLWKNIESLEKIGFSLYVSALSFMSISAFYFSLKSRFDSNLKFASVAIFFGSVIFMISDTTLSERQRNDSIDSHTKKIMSYVVGVTYWTAQFLIAQGGLKIAKVVQQVQQIEKTLLSSEAKQTVLTSETIAEPLL